MGIWHLVGSVCPHLVLAQTPLLHGKKLVQKNPVWPHMRFTALLSKCFTCSGPFTHSASKPQFPYCKVGIAALSQFCQRRRAFIQLEFREPLSAE